MAWLKFFESAGNHVLAYDPDFLEQLQPFFKKTFRIELTEPVYTFDLRACPDGFIVEPAGEQNPEVSLRGSLWAFSKLAREGSHSEVFAKGRITMNGDAELGQAFQRVLGDMQIDWEEMLASVAGDATARGVSRAAHKMGAWFKQSSHYFSENTGDFLREELGMTPSKVEVDAQGKKIESLRSDTARLEARIMRLQTSNHPAKS